MLNYPINRPGKVRDMRVTRLFQITRQRKLIILHTRKSNFRENPKCPLARNPSRKECIKMMKSTIAKKNNEENKRNKNKNAMKNKTKEATKSPKPQLIMINKSGIKYFLNKNLIRSLLRKRIPHQLFRIQKLIKIQVSLVLINKEIIKNHGWEMPRKKIKRKINKIKNKAKENLS